MPTSKSNRQDDPFYKYQQKQGSKGYSVYVAGFPKFPANFSRDVIVAGVIASRADLLASQLMASADNQGKQYNPQTGEEPGKPHHEIPGTMLPGREGQTTYNACDTGALFLIAAEGLGYLDKVRAKSLLSRIKPNIEQAVDYILSHLEEGFFVEIPPKGATGFALKVTYWKDSMLPSPSGKEEPVYPVIYPIAHFMSARGMLSASRLLNDDGLNKVADNMYRSGIKEFMAPHGYMVYRDSEEELRQPSSDELHSLAYIPPDYRALLPIDAIQKRAEVLATPFGYMCTPIGVASQLADKYHGDKVWPYEQAVIHYGATKFGLRNEANTAEAVAEFIGKGQELLSVLRSKNDVMSPIPAGNDRQLWSVAASEYFAGRSQLTENQWL